jgi:hypothetical protein
MKQRNAAARNGGRTQQERAVPLLPITPPSKLLLLIRKPSRMTNVVAAPIFSGHRRALAALFSADSVQPQAATAPKDIRRRRGSSSRLDAWGGKPECSPAGLELHAVPSVSKTPTSSSQVPLRLGKHIDGPLGCHHLNAAASGPQVNGHQSQLCFDDCGAEIIGRYGSDCAYRWWTNNCGCSRACLRSSRSPASVARRFTAGSPRVRSRRLRSSVGALSPGVDPTWTAGRNRATPRTTDLPRAARGVKGGRSPAPAHP